MQSLTFVVAGVPRPKGSLRHLGRGRMVEQSKAGPAWRAKIAHAAWLAAHRDGWPAPYPGAVAVSGVFAFARPVRRTGPATSRRLGDLDKLLRNVADALTDSGVVCDDSQITEICGLKFYLDELDASVLAEPGVRVHIRALTDTKE